MFDPEVETRPWEDQLALDDASFRLQLEYLRARSSFYRNRLAGLERMRLTEIAELPLTEKDELRATRTPDNPIGAHLCADEAELVRIYSTSGTTGTPSYVPLTASDLENWVTTSARSYAASGIEAGLRIATTYNAGPFVAGRHSRPSSGSASRTSRSGPAPPSGSFGRSSSCGRKPSC